MRKPNPTGRRSDGGRFAQLPLCVIKHSAVTTLTPAERWVLVALAGQFSGGNNGALCLTRGVAKEYGIRSADTLGRSLGVLQTRGLIEQTHAGSYVPATAARYAIAWHALNQTQWSSASRTASHRYRSWEGARATKPPRKPCRTTGTRAGRIPKINCAARPADPSGPASGTTQAPGAHQKGRMGPASGTILTPSRVRPADTSRYLPDGETN